MFVSAPRAEHHPAANPPLTSLLRDSLCIIVLSDRQIRPGNSFLVASLTGTRSLGRGGSISLVRSLAALLGVLFLPDVLVEVAGDGTVTFAAGRAIDSDALDVYTLIAVDLDGDGDLDIVAAMRYWDEVFWYENVDGAGTFSARDGVSLYGDRLSPR